MTRKRDGRERARETGREIVIMWRRGNKRDIDERGRVRQKDEERKGNMSNMREREREKKS